MNRHLVSALAAAAMLQAGPLLAGPRHDAPLAVSYVSPAEAASRATLPARRDVAGRVLCPRRMPVLREVTLRDGTTQLRCAALQVAHAAGLRGSQPLIPPAGYKSAWDDGRLNPLRGRGTAEGTRAMRRYWTDGVPMQGKPSATEPPPLLW